MKLTQTYKKLFKEEFSEYDREHLPDIIGKKEGDWFSAHLLRLIAKADLGNRRLLAKGFPEEVRAVNEWQGINEEKDIYEKAEYFEQDIRSLAKQFLSIYLDENKNELLETMSEYIVSKLERSKNPSYSDEELKNAVGLVEKIYDQITIRI